jgi:hypothetical protein
MLLDIECNLIEGEGLNALAACLEFNKTIQTISTAGNLSSNDHAEKVTANRKSSLSNTDHELKYINDIYNISKSSSSNNRYTTPSDSSTNRTITTGPSAIMKEKEVYSSSGRRPASRSHRPGSVERSLSREAVHKLPRGEVPGRSQTPTKYPPSSPLPPSLMNPSSDNFNTEEMSHALQEFNDLFSPANPVNAFTYNLSSGLRLQSREGRASISSSQVSRPCTKEIAIREDSTGDSPWRVLQSQGMQSRNGTAGRRSSDIGKTIGVPYIGTMVSGEKKKTYINLIMLISFYAIFYYDNLGFISFNIII